MEWMKHMFPRIFGRLSRTVQAVLPAAVLGFVLAHQPVMARAAPDSFADLAERLAPAVVNIATSQRVTNPYGEQPQLPPGSPFEDLFRDYFGDGNSRVTSLGSGFVIDSSGVIVTNNHVIADADEILVTFPDGTSLPATLVGKDEKTDIAVLRVQPSTPLASVAFGNSDSARTGDWVMAIGNPFGLGGSVSAGIISARNRDISAGPYDDFIQTDAAINRGNSGGPLFDMDGNVIGVNTAIISPTGGSIGIGFAVPSNLVNGVVQQLLQFGETRRGWIGVRIQTVTPEIAESLGLDRARGALLGEITPDGPAAQAGLQVGDVVVTFDGKPVEAMRDLPRVVAETEVGRTVSLEYFRNGSTSSTSITLGRLEDFEASIAGTTPGVNNVPVPDGEVGPAGPASVVPTALGLGLSAITDELRQRFGIPAGVDGVVIVDIQSNTPAAIAASEGRVRAGDVIVEVAQEQVRSPEDVVAKVKSVVDANGRVVLFLLNRGGELSFVPIRVDQG